MVLRSSRSRPRDLGGEPFGPEQSGVRGISRAMAVRIRQVGPVWTIAAGAMAALGLDVAARSLVLAVTLSAPVP